MAGGHLSSWNDWNGFCKVKPYDADMAVTSLPLHFLPICWQWQKPSGLVGEGQPDGQGSSYVCVLCSFFFWGGGLLSDFKMCLCDNRLIHFELWTSVQRCARPGGMRNARFLSELNIQPEIRWVWSYWEQIYPQTQTLVQSLTPGLCYLCNPASIKYTYDCTYTQPQTHTYTHTGTHYRHPAHTLFQSGLHRSRDRRPHHIERTVLGSITPVRPGHSTGLGWGRDSGEVGWRWCWREAGWGSGGGVVCWVGAVLSRSCFAKDGEVSQHKFRWYHLHQRAIKLIYYKYSSHVFTARILGPATSFKVSTCRCSGSVSVGQIGGNQGKKGRKAKTGTGRHGEKGAVDKGRKRERDNWWWQARKTWQP